MYEKTTGEWQSKVNVGPYQQAGSVGNAGVAPRESGPLGKATEALQYLIELEMLHSDLRRKLYGNFPETANDAKNCTSSQLSLEEMLLQICQRAAMLSGDCKNLLSRLD